MAHLHKKIKKGRPYYYVREIARVDGKPKVINQAYLGSPERMLEMATKSTLPSKYYILPKTLYSNELSEPPFIELL